MIQSHCHTLSVFFLKLKLTRSFLLALLHSCFVAFFFFAVFPGTYDNELKPELTPEMLRVPLTEMCLNVLVTQMKIPLRSTNNSRMTVEHYLSLALDPPEPKAIRAALTTLEEVGAITILDNHNNHNNHGNNNHNNHNNQNRAMKNKHPNNEEEEQVRTVGTTRIEPLGMLLAQIPADVKIGKILIMGSMMKCLRPSLIVAASLAYKTPFVTPMDKRTEAEMARKEFHRSSKEEGGQPLRSDHLAIVNAYTLFITKMTSKTMKRNAIQHWCRTKYLSYQTLHSMKSTIAEFEGYLTSMGLLAKKHGGPHGREGGGVPYQKTMDLHAKKPFVVLAAISSGLWPNVATVTKHTRIGSGHVGHGKPIVAIQNKMAAIHPSSINHNVSVEALLQHTGSKKSGFLCYHDLMQTSKCYLRDTSVVSPTAILLLCGNGSDASIVFGKQQVIVNDWIKVKITSKAAVLILKVRKKLNEHLLDKVAHPRRKENKEDQKLFKMLTRLLEV